MKYMNRYTVPGTSETPVSFHATKREARKEASQFMRTMKIPGSRKDCYTSALGREVKRWTHPVYATVMVSIGKNTIER